MELTLDPAVVVALVVLEGLYLRAVRRLRARGQRVGAGQQALWHGGIALEAVALLGPLDPLAEDLLSAHMAQHLLLADLGAPLLLAGARAPVVLFLLPRGALVALARRPRLRAAFRTVRQPLVAVPLFVAVLYGWHVAPAFEGALGSPALHALQHQSFLVAGLLVWWSAIEPRRRRAPGALWKIPYLFAARLAAMFLGMAFLLMRSPAYSGHYGERAREHGLSPLADQQLAGGMMMVLDGLIILFALTFFFWRAAQDEDRDQAARDEDLLAEAEELAAPPAGAPASPVG